LKPATRKRRRNPDYSMALILNSENTAAQKGALISLPPSMQLDKKANIEAAEQQLIISLE